MECVVRRRSIPIRRDDGAIARSGAAVDPRGCVVLRVRDRLSAGIQQRGGQDRAPLTANRVWFVLIVALAVSALSFRWSTYSAGGSDSSGYVSQAYSWLYGPLPRPLPVTAKLPWPSATASLAPLGYMAAPGNQGIVPTYAPGLPLMMAGLLRVAGPRGPYFVVPCSPASSCGRRSCSVVESVAWPSARSRRCSSRSARSCCSRLSRR